MWLNNKSVNDIVALAFKPQCLAFAHIRKTHTQVPYTMLRYKQTAFNNLELEKQIIFNPTHIGKYISTLLCEYGLGNADIRMSLEGPTIFETLSATAEPGADELDMQLKNLVWEDIVIPLDSTASIRYVCGISRELLFQYKLLAIKHALNITCITTSNAALLNFIEKLPDINKAQRPTKIEDIAPLISTSLIHGQCANIPTQNPLLIAELVGLSTVGLSYEND